MALQQDRMNAGIRTSPWIIIWATLILLIVVLYPAIQNIQRDRRHMTEVLSTKGGALIRAVEAGTRTGMMGMMWGSAQVQQLLEETARLPEVLYMAVITPEGRILADSDPSQIGKLLHPEHPPKHIGPDFEENTEWITLQDGRLVFEVHRFFRPFGFGRGRDQAGPMLRRGGRENPDDEWLTAPPEKARLIVVGLDPTSFEKVIAADIQHSIMISVVLLLMGFAGFVSLFWMNSYRAARRSLQDTSAFADEVVTHLPVGLIATDRSGRIAFFNSTAERMTGLSRATVLGQDPEHLLPGNLCGLKSLLDQGQSITEKEMECAFAVGRPVPISISATRIVNEVGQLVGHVLILRDLGEVKRLQAEIRRQEKLAALGGLAAGVAHEIRNPLSSIKGLATYFAGKFAEDSHERELAQIMTQEVDRLNRVISELLEFARPTDVKLRRSTINVVLQHSLQLIEQDAHVKQIEIVRDFSPQAGELLIDPDRLAQCLLNLYLNAIQAMSAGGRLTVASHRPVDGQVHIEVIDTGTGIDATDLDNIFNPYFTTKPKGTGLGLAIVHKIMEAHQAHIQVESAPGKGTRFILIFPDVKEEIERLKEDEISNSDR